MLDIGSFNKMRLLWRIMTNEELEKELGVTKEAVWKLETEIAELEQKVKILENKNKFDRSILMDLDR